MKRLFLSWAFNLAGWKLKGEPLELKKYVIAVAPHTSNLDFFVALPVKYMFPHKFRPGFLGKDSLFTIPLVGWFLRSIGGIPVNRSKKSNVVDDVVKIFDQEERFIMVISPEGTRSYVPKWRTGFYYIALKAKVPIMLAALDYEHKTVDITEVMEPTGDVVKDILYMRRYFSQFKGRYPEKGVVLEEEEIAKAL